MNGINNKLVLHTKKQLEKIEKRLLLSEVVNKFAPIPGEAIYMGVADDELPVLFNTEDTTRIRNIVIWDKMAKQGLRILKVIVEYLFYYHKLPFIYKFKSPNPNIEFVVLTNSPEEWGELNEYGMGMRGNTSCIGIIPFDSEVADTVIRGLARWITEQNGSSKSPVIILMDGLENLENMSEDFKQDFRFILLAGHKKRVFVMGTASKNNFQKIHQWLEGFSTEIYGCEMIDTFDMQEGNKPLFFYAPKTEMI